MDDQDLHDDEPQERSPRKRLALIIVATFAATGLISYGGLAAWTAYTENDANTVAAGTLTHSNTVGSTTCTSVVTGSPTGCAAAFTVSNVSPSTTDTAASPLASGTVIITNTGSLQALFAMSMPAAPSGSLCADLTLTVQDLNSTAPDAGGSTTGIYPATALTTTMGSTNLYNNAGTPSFTWAANGTAGVGTGATGQTFKVIVHKGASFNTNSSDQGTSCSFNLKFTQTNA